MPLIYDPAALRAELHEMPELAMQERKTAAYVAEKLRALGLEPQTDVGGTPGVVAYIRGEEPGPVLMLRADMDALPFTIDGKACAIHACGHDAHTAMVLAAASRLVGRVRKGAVKLVFQPAEEDITGADALIRAGVTKDVDLCLGAHIRPLQDLAPGTLCAGVNHIASSTAYVHVRGKGAHAARPHLGVNAISAAAAVVSAVESLWLDPTKSWSAKATQFHADSGATNTVPDRAEITFDIRAQTNPLMTEYCSRIVTAAECAARALGAEASVEFAETCPAADYDADFREEVREAIVGAVGEANLAEDCGGGGEDFHNYKIAKPSVKSAYFGVGVGATPGLHAPDMTFDPKYLQNGVEVFVRVALRHVG